MTRAPAAAFLVLAVLAVLTGLTACRLDSRDDYVGDKNPGQFGLGTPATAEQIAAANVDVSPTGAGLPPGSGTPEQGAAVYAARCASCHGANGEGQAPAYPQLVGGPQGDSIDFAAGGRVPRTIGNYWPYATTLYGYIRRAMPFTAPGSLTPDETYAVTAYLLSRERLIASGAVMNARTLPQVRMPARSRFVPDDRRGSTGGASVR
ncbi:MAG: c-type cytochrome [Gemmatimonadaceae bacterium]